MEKIIGVTQNKCKQCFTCVRNCPVKAVKIKDNQAEILISRCINCGKCINSCPQNAKIVIDSKAKSLEILNSNRKAIAIIAPSFVSSFYKYDYKKVIGALKEIGFSEVWEVAIGAEVLMKEISEYIKNDDKQYISSACPAFVTLIEKHYPELIDSLVPYVSPMISTGQIIKKKYENTDVIFIGPCVAKKAEAELPKFKGIVDVVLTFDEIKEIINDKNVNINSSKESDFDSDITNKGKLFPLSGGFLKNLVSFNILDDNKYIYVDGEKDTLNLVESLVKGDSSYKIFDVLMCKGCIEGPKIDSDISYYNRIDKVKDYYNESKIEYNYLEVESDYNIDFSRDFNNRRNILPLPAENEIINVLKETDKLCLEDELNCGACGYNTCREKAIAVLQGIAEVDMCLPYLITKKNNLVDSLSFNLNEITLLKDQLETVIETSYDGLVVTDSKGKIIKSNKSFKRMIEADKSGVGIKNKEGLFCTAASLAIKEKRRITFLQTSLDGNKYLSTATPIINESGEVTRVVTNIRDIEELNRLREQLEQTTKLEKYRSTEKKLEKIDISNNIVANSIEFGEILQNASNVAGVDSTILILGESGVGKEIIVKFIHSISNRREKPLIKINCGAIPENLIESELFGYETGAFTGAQKKGKPGLIELADSGILFLDEIGELPLNLQVKLLRAIQERKFMRIGGTEEKEVDVRFIAATNKNLYEMVQKGEFRSDLYYRLNVVPIEIPPLRNRRADILPLCYHFLDVFNKRYNCNKKLNTSVERVLYSYDWPGNVRELENLIERLVVTIKDDFVEEKDLPIFLYNKINENISGVKVEGIMPLKEATEILERQLLEEAYKKYKTTYEMANALGVNQSTIVRKLQKYLHFNALKHN